MSPRIAAAALLAAALAACSSEPPTADLALFGPVWTGDADRPVANAVAIRGDSILAVGDSAEVAAVVGPGTEVVTTSGLILPAFADGHVHLLGTGAGLASVQLRDAATPDEFVRRIAEYARTLAPGEWILEGNWDHETWGGELPTRQWIDSVTPDNPVFVSRTDGHNALANSQPPQLAGTDRSMAEVPGGTIVRDATGELTGVLKDEAMNPVWAVVPEPSAEQADSAIAAAMRHANARGLAAISAVSASRLEIASVRRLRSAGLQTLRVSFYPPLGQWQWVAESLAANGPGDEWVRLAGVKGFVDGSLGSTTALFFDPYLDEPGSIGLAVTPEPELRAMIGAADSAGLQVVVHAIGDRANALLMDVFDSVADAHGARDRRFRIEHAQHLRAREIEKMAISSVLASMQPYHAADDGRWAAKRIREPQLRGTYAFRSILDAGGTLVFGSDAPVAPIDPLLGIWAAVARQTIDGANPDGWYPEQRVTLEEALRAYTAANAFATFGEARRGVLRAGMLADVVVLDRDLRTVPPAEIPAGGVQATIVGGRVVHRQ